VSRITFRLLTRASGLACRHPRRASVVLLHHFTCALRGPSISSTIWFTLTPGVVRR
jgi:hypothetical protein